MIKNSQPHCTIYITCKLFSAQRTISHLQSIKEFLYLSFEAVSQAAILHVFIHQAGGGAIIAISNQGQDVTMMVPNVVNIIIILTKWASDLYAHVSMARMVR